MTFRTMPFRRPLRVPTPFAPAALLVLLLTLAALPAPADPPPSRSGLRVTVSAVDAGVFHVVVTPPQLPAPPASPFVVETTPLPSATTGRNADGVTVRTAAGRLQMQAGGRFSLQDRAGRALVSAGQVIAGEDGSLTLTLAHSPGDRFYGAGNADRDVAGDLLHPAGTQIVTNGATRVPFLWSPSGYGVLIANDQTGASWADAGGVLTWRVPGPDLDFYLLAAPDPYGLLDAFSRLTGRAPIPPRWTFGYLQSRWGYVDAADVQDKWHQFRDRQIPVDAFIYDYDWFVDDWRFNPVTFPPGSLDKMHEMGLHFIGIRKPRVNGANLDFARQQGWVLSSPQGTDLRFDLPQARQWWWGHQAPLAQAGVDGWWNDEAEQTADEFFQMAQAEWDGGRALDSRRPWSINRAFAPGMQRFGAAVWTGDIDSDWKTLAQQPGTLLNWELAGMPYVAQDIGGFQSTPTPELYARWIEEGVFVPVMRAHGTHNSPRWPWAFGDDVLAATKQAIQLRYRLLPYLYTCAAETARTGAPWMRPLFLEFPQDAATFNLRDEWLVGSRLLAAPVLAEGGRRAVYLPAGRWYDFNTGASVEGGRTLTLVVPLSTIPAYVRAGSILPLGPVLQYTGQAPEDPLEVRVFPGADARFVLYEDAGDGFGYLSGQSAQIPLAWDDHARRLTVGARLGSYPGMTAVRHLRVTLPGGRAQTVTYRGDTVRAQF